MAVAALGIADRGPDALQLLDCGIDTARRLGDAAEFRYLAVLHSQTAFYAGHLLEAEADGASFGALVDRADLGGMTDPTARRTRRHLRLRQVRWSAPGEAPRRPPTSQGTAMVLSNQRRLLPAQATDPVGGCAKGSILTDALTEDRH